MIEPYATGPRKSIAYAIAAWLAGLSSLLPAQISKNEKDRYVFDTIERVPLSSLPLGNAALIAPVTMKELGIEPEQEAQLSVADRKVRVLLYPINRAKGSISLKPELRKKLGVQPGPARVELTLIDKDEAILESEVQKIRVVANEGDTDRWPGVVLGSPHGDCDLYTGDIVKLATETCGIPSVSVFGSRITYVGRWIDANRPLQRRPDGTTFGILPNRDWTDEAVAVFDDFRKKAIQVGASPDQEPGQLPLRLYLDFHGHDLTVTDKDNNRIYRNVFECVARGFNSDEVERIKKIFDRCVKSEYGDEAPPSYWGNLPADQLYRVSGIETKFFYNGLGARVYGILASDIASRAIHIESPNMMRLPEENRIRTARVLCNFLKSVSNDVVPASITRQSLQAPVGDTPKPDSWTTVPTGEFVAGAPPDEEWSLEHPQHRVNLDEYEIGIYEVTCAQFARFLNEQLIVGSVELVDGEAVAKPSGHTWCTLFPRGPLAMLQVDGGEIGAVSGRENHPVNYVSWYGANAYARAHQANLPSEAQWERAAAWNEADKRPYRTSISIPRFGVEVPAALMNGGADTENFASPSTSPVGRFSNAKSPVGCFDMAGNVWEWTIDWFGKYPDSNDVMKNPVGPETGTMKVIRGGGWDSEPYVASPTYRISVHPNQTLPNLGFRLARNKSEGR